MHLSVMRKGWSGRPGQSVVRNTDGSLFGNRKRPRSEDRGLSILSRRRPTFPHSYPCSIVGPARLNFRVRDGNGCDPRGMITGNLLELEGGKRSSAPCAQNRTPCGQAAWATTEFGWHYKFG